MLFVSIPGGPPLSPALTGTAKIRWLSWHFLSRLTTLNLLVHGVTKFSVDPHVSGLH